MHRKIYFFVFTSQIKFFKFTLFVDYLLGKTISENVWISVTEPRHKIIRANLNFNALKHATNQKN